MVIGHTVFGALKVLNSSYDMDVVVVFMLQISSIFVEKHVKTVILS